MIFDDILEQINMNILTWQNENISLKDMWRLPEDKFVSKQRDMVDYIDCAFNIFTGPDADKTVSGTELMKRV
jgi:hypothetical protein